MLMMRLVGFSRFIQYIYIYIYIYVIIFIDSATLRTVHESTRHVKTPFHYTKCGRGRGIGRIEGR